jgi:GNAT superfamily N-acetyltransferase
LADPGEPRPLYREPGRSYASLAIFGGVIVVGVAIDAALGGLREHIVGWIIAAVLLLGVDLLIIYAARSQKSLTVTQAQVRIGDAFIERPDIVAGTVGAAEEVPVLAWTSGMPRGMDAVTLRLRDGYRVAVPTRRPDRLLRALGYDPAAVEVPAVRPAVAAEWPLLVEIDERAESVFRVAGHELPVIDIDPADFAAAAAVFVVGEPPVGFARVDVVDGCAHLAELAVVPGEMRKGLGGQLLEHVCEWARSEGYGAVTLCTYRDVPWNAPFYAKRGFVVDPAPSAGLVAVRVRERDQGLDDVGPRVVMCREI